MEFHRSCGDGSRRRRVTVAVSPRPRRGGVGSFRRNPSAGEFPPGSFCRNPSAGELDTAEARRGEAAGSPHLDGAVAQAPPAAEVEPDEHRQQERRERAHRPEGERHDLRVRARHARRRAAAAARRAVRHVEPAEREPDPAPRAVQHALMVTVMVMTTGK